jgi:GAF domain-containing protein
MNDDRTDLADLDRMREIAAQDLFNPQLRDRLDALCKRTAERMSSPVALVTAIIDGAQIMLGAHGLEGTWIGDVGGTPSEWAFCTRVVVQRAPYISPDLVDDPVQAENPTVHRDGARSYAGFPLPLPSGQILGTHCVVGFEPRSYNDEELRTLEAAAAEATDLIAKYRHSPN